MAVFLVMLLTVATAGAQTERKMPDFSRYLPSVRLSAKFAQHQEGNVRLVEMHGAPRLPKQEIFLAITTFDVNEDGKLCFISDTLLAKTGVHYHEREVFDWAVQGGGPSQLSEKGMAEVKAEIAALPAEDEFPALENLAVVTYRSETAWVTRAFHKDRADKIFQIFSRNTIPMTGDPR